MRRVTLSFVDALARRALAPLLVLVLAGVQAAALRCELDCLGESERASSPAAAPATACTAGHGHETSGDRASQPRQDPPAHGKDCEGYFHSGAGAALASAKAPAANRAMTAALLLDGSNAGAPDTALGQARAMGTAASTSPPRIRSSVVLRI
jgi:hypothetical protein